MNKFYISILASLAIGISSAAVAYEAGASGKSKAEARTKAKAGARNVCKYSDSRPVDLEVDCYKRNSVIWRCEASFDCD